MDRDHLPHLTHADGEVNEKGWLLMAEHGIPVIFLSLPGIRGLNKISNHTVDTNGEVNASVLTTQQWGDVVNEYHAFVTLDDWPSNTYKVAGEDVLRTV